MIDWLRAVLEQISWRSFQPGKPIIHRPPPEDWKKKENMDIKEKYTVEIERKKSHPGCWDVLTVHILQTQEDGSKVEIGSYDRNYHSLFQTFYPFEQNGKEYALYSKDYTSTRVMTLPDCKDLCGEESHKFGFCPTGYLVPVADEDDLGTEFDPKGQFGFVSGCVWGDDSSWKIQYLDLSKIEKGILVRDARMGYIELLDSQELADAVNIDLWEEDHHQVEISCKNTFDLSKDVNDESEQ